MDKDVVHIYNGILPSHKKNKTMPFAVTLMNLEIFISSKSERGQIPHDIAYRQNLKYDTNERI